MKHTPLVPPPVALHICCGPCACGCIPRFIAPAPASNNPGSSPVTPCVNPVAPCDLSRHSPFGATPEARAGTTGVCFAHPLALFFSNSNLADACEYEKRLEAARTVAAHFGVELVADPYRHDDWLKHVSQLPGYESFPEGGARCRLCFQYSLARTAEYASAHGMRFATSLTVSPHKNSKVIFDVGSQWQNFEPLDFKKKNGFALSIAISKKLNLYRQDFCGCEFSRRKK